MGEAHKEGNGGAGRQQVGTMRFRDFGRGGGVEERGQYPFKRGKVQDRYHDILRQHKTSKDTPTHW